MNPKAQIKKVDDLQQRKRWLGFPFAVVKKFGDDQAGNLAALIAYYGFFSMFPLLLVFVTLLGMLLHGSSLQTQIQNSVLNQFPVIGTELKLGKLSGNGIALGIGILTALWAGLGVTQAAQNAMNTVWDVPKKERPNFIQSRLRGLVMLVVLGTITVASAVVSGLGAAGSGLGVILRIVAFLGGFVLNLALFLLAYRILADRKLSWADVFPGAAVAAALWVVLQFVGTYYVGHEVKNAGRVYGTFAFVIGLLVWIYLGAQLFLYCAEINVVRVKKLWPRSIVQPPLTEADKRMLKQAAEVEERLPQEDDETTHPEARMNTSHEAPNAAAGDERSAPPTAKDERRSPTARKAAVLRSAGALVGVFALAFVARSAVRRFAGHPSR
jgi:YihY family inner membrane protein